MVMRKDAFNFILVEHLDDLMISFKRSLYHVSSHTISQKFESMDDIVVKHPKIFRSLGNLIVYFFIFSHFSFFPIKSFYLSRDSVLFSIINKINFVSVK